VALRGKDEIMASARALAAAELSASMPKACICTTPDTPPPEDDSSGQGRIRSYPMAMASISSNPLTLRRPPLGRAGSLQA
jgi:hypothetical protein